MVCNIPLDPMADPAAVGLVTGKTLPIVLIMAGCPFIGHKLPMMG